MSATEEALPVDEAEVAQEPEAEAPQAEPVAEPAPLFSPLPAQRENLEDLLYDAATAIRDLHGMAMRCVSWWRGRNPEPKRAPSSPLAAAWRELKELERDAGEDAAVQRLAQFMSAWATPIVHRALADYQRAAAPQQGPPISREALIDYLRTTTPVPSTNGRKRSRLRSVTDILTN